MRSQSLLIIPLVVTAMPWVLWVLWVPVLWVLSGRLARPWRRLWAAPPAAPEHMTPCACHCAACRAAGHGNACVVLRVGLLRLFRGKTDIVDLVLRHYRGASGWGAARFDAAIHCVQYGPAGDVIAAGDALGGIHLICAQTGEKIMCLVKGHAKDNEECTCRHDEGPEKNLYWSNVNCRLTEEGNVFSIDFAPCGNKLAAACNLFGSRSSEGVKEDSYSVKLCSKDGSTGEFVCQATLKGHTG